jgi:hypothetical protein
MSGLLGQYLGIVEENEIGGKGVVSWFVLIIYYILRNEIRLD